MPVIRVIQSKGARCEVFMNTNGNAYMEISQSDDPGGIGCGFIEMDADDLLAFIKLCQEVLNDIGNA